MATESTTTNASYAWGVVHVYDKHGNLLRTVPAYSLEEMEEILHGDWYKRSGAVALGNDMDYDDPAVQD